MRAFIGTLLSGANQEVSDAFGAQVIGASRGVLRAVPARSAHVTHAFLGEVDESLARAIADDLQNLMASLVAVPFALGPPEVLRAGREPRLLHAHVEGGRSGVSAVTHRIVDRLRRHPPLAAIAPARSPHVTLARFRRGADSRDAGWVEDLIATPGMEPPWQIDRLHAVELIQSELTRNGPIYRVVARAPAAPA